MTVKELKDVLEMLPEKAHVIAVDSGSRCGIHVLWQPKKPGAIAQSSYFIDTPGLKGETPRADF